LGGGDASDCFLALKDLILDAFVSKAVLHDPSELLLVQPSATKGAWIARVLGTAGDWQCLALNLDRLDDVDTSYAVADVSDQRQAIVHNHADFMRSFGALFSRREPQANTLLRAKVAPREHWFLWFTLSGFIRHGLPGFDKYSACQVLVTDRSISTVVWTQAQTERELADTETFLAGTHLVLNTYGRTSAVSAEPLDEGFGLLVDILRQLNNIRFQHAVLDLKWALNPSASQLRDILLSPSTKFVFADFEAAGECWTLGNGPRIPATSAVVGDETFNVGELHGRLQHIRLLRVFHCNSLYDPGRWNAQPIDEATLASRLLATGAFFVEGSVTAEPVTDFVCSTLLSLLGRSDLRAILMGKSLIEECDLSSLIARANKLLSAQRFQTITEEAV
jgi:hypothetical protein